MQLLAMAEARAGLVLARPVANQAGAVLCQAGSVLTESLIERLVNAGIEAVYVQGGSRQGPAPAERLQALQARFAGVRDPALLELKSAAEAVLQALGEEEESPRDS